MVDLFQAYKGRPTPVNVVILAREVLSDKEDTDQRDLFCFFLALNADQFNAKQIYQKLSKRFKPGFIEQYNRAYLVSRVWSKLIGFTTGRQLRLANIFLPKKAEKNPFLYYKLCFNGSRRRLEKRWREILGLY